MLRHFPLKGTARVYTYVIPTASPFYVIPMTEGRRNLRTGFLADDQCALRIGPFGSE